MAPDGAELLIMAIAMIALSLAPLASRLIHNVSQQVSRELDGGRTGASLQRHLDANFAAQGGDDTVREEEIRQLLAARSFLRRSRGEEPLDVEAETARLLAGGSVADLAVEPDRHLQDRD